MDAILFARCLGINDSGRMTTQITNASPESDAPGATELLDCLNVTTSEDGAIESIPDFATVLTHSAPVLSLSSEKRFLYQDATDTLEWDGNASALRFPLKTGAMVHTPVDCRVGLFKSLNASPTMQAVTVGTSNGPETSKVFSGMPAYAHAFHHAGRLYAINAADPRFLQFSERYNLDLWSYANGFIGHTHAIIAAGAINGALLVLNTHGAEVYLGTGAHDFVRKTHACRPLAGTLFSGYLGKAFGHGHLFLADDGLYLVTSDGGFTRLTGNRLNHTGTLNASYKKAVVEGGKYLAIGNSVVIEFNIETKAVMKRAVQGVTSATIWKETAYFSTGNLIVKHDDRSALPVSITLPYSKLAFNGRKGIQDLFFTGETNGEMTITATGLDGNTWTVVVPALGEVYNHRIKVPKAILGNHISFTIETADGAFRMERLTASVNTSNRVK